MLHDWPDAEVKLILENTRHAMRPGYSRLLIDDVILDEENLGPETMDDVSMMMLVSGKNRTAAEW